MKWKRMLEWWRPQEEIIASFGDTKLVRRLDGRTELRGGTPDERQKAREWMAHFWHGGNVRFRD